jgi:hypothetical protein
MKTLLTLLAAAVFAGQLQAQLLPVSQTDRDLAALDQSISGAQYYLGLYVQSLNRVHSSVWSLPDERLAAALEKVGPAGVAQLIALHEAAADAANQLLDASGTAGPRAQGAPTREFLFNADGTVEIVPLPEPEPEVVEEDEDDQSE